MISSPACTCPVPMSLNLPWPQSVNISMIAKRVSLSSAKTLHEGYRSRDVSAKQHPALRTAAFRPLHTVGFPSLRPEDDPIDHDSTYFGAPSRRLHARSVQLRTPVTGCARGLHSCPAGQAVGRWDVLLSVRTP